MHTELHSLSFKCNSYCIGILYFPGAGDVWFSLNGTTYQNNSVVTLEDIGEGDDALLCVINLTDCCSHGDGNWYFPNGSRVLSHSDWDFYRDRGKMVVRLYRRRGGEDGIYCCEMPDSMNVTQSIYIGVYTTGDGEWHFVRISILFSSTKFMLQCVYCLKIQNLQFFVGTLFQNIK